LISDPKEQELIFQSWPGPQPIMVHVNGPEVQQVISLSQKYNKSVHVCHVTGDQMEFIVNAKKQTIKITCEVTPHHLFLQKNDLPKLGSLGEMKPPLEDEASQHLLWENLESIDMVATDHAPHTLAEKQQEPAPFGVPGLETALPLMLNAVFEKKLSIEKLISMMAEKPREIFYLPVQDDTYVQVEDAKVYPLADLKLQTKCQWTPFSSLQGRGEITKVVLRGTTVYEGGMFLGKPSGKVMRPQVT